MSLISSGCSNPLLSSLSCLLLVGPHKTNGPLCLSLRTAVQWWRGLLRLSRLNLPSPREPMVDSLMRGQHPRRKSLLGWSVELVGCGMTIGPRGPRRHMTAITYPRQTAVPSVPAFPLWGGKWDGSRWRVLNTSKCQSGLEIQVTTRVGVRQSFVDSSKFRFNQTDLIEILFSKHCLSPTWCRGFVTKDKRPELFSTIICCSVLQSKTMVKQGGWNSHHC